MSTVWTATAAVFSCLALTVTGCAAERLEARDPERGPTAASSPTTPVERPTRLTATEKQLASTPDEAAPRPEAVPTHPHHEHGGSPAQPPTKPQYVCPMHPEVEAPEPGDCPKCGMKLKPKERAP